MPDTNGDGFASIIERLDALEQANATANAALTGANAALATAQNANQELIENLQQAELRITQLETVVNNAANNSGSDANTIRRINRVEHYIGIRGVELDERF